MTIYSLDGLLSQFGTSHFSMSGSNYYYLTCIQVSQEIGKVVCYSHVFKNFPYFSVIHTVKGFGIVNETEVDFFFSGIPLLFCNPKDVGNLISGSLTLLNPTCTSGNSQFTYCWSLAWRILSITLVACEMSAIVQEFGHSLVLPLGLEWKLTFPVLWSLLTRASAGDTQTLKSYHIYISLSDLLHSV